MTIILGIIGIIFAIGIIVGVLQLLWEAAKGIISIILIIGLIFLAITHIKITLIILVIIGILCLIGNSFEKEKQKNMKIIENCINKLGMADINTIKNQTQLSEEKLKEAIDQLYENKKIEKEIMNQNNKSGQTIYKSINIKNGNGTFTNYHREEINLD